MKISRNQLLLTASLVAAGSALAALVVPQTVYLDELDTSFVGEAAGDEAGQAMTSDDFNGDGYEDLVIGAPKANSGVGRESGKVYFIFGKAAGVESPWDWRMPLSQADISYTGMMASDHLGAALAAIGDVNHDGLPDLAIGAPNADGGSNVGRVYLVFGKDEGWESGPVDDVADASYLGKNGEQVGYALSKAGDVNRDNLKDFLVGSYRYDLPNGDQWAGRAFLILGKSTGWSRNMDIVNSADASFAGETSYELLGQAVAGGGDLNGDGYDDIVIGCPGDVGANAQMGQVGIVFGKLNGWVRNQPLSDAAGAIYRGEKASDQAGKSIAILDSIESDAYAELAIGAPRYSPSTSVTTAGKVYLVKGKASGWSKTAVLSSADGSWVGENSLDLAGSAVGAAGNVNRDGVRDDLMVGAYFNGEGGTQAGKTYIIFLSSSLPKSGSLADADLQLVGHEAYSRSGYSFAGQLDMDNDGYRDLAIGAPKSRLDDQNSNAGAVYLFRGIIFQDTDEDGYSPFTGDCDDDANDVYPDATEVAYDGIDQDCDGEDLVDVDEDGYASEEVGGNDCEDGDPAIHPGATEDCDGVDDDCTGIADDGLEFVDLYRDSDSDGYGTGDATSSCRPMMGYVATPGDCDDQNPTTHPNATEDCDGIDDNCNGVADEGVQTPYYADSDGDGYGMSDDTVMACAKAPTGYVATSGDCDDEDPEINPGQEDILYDGIDQDCSGSDYADLDGDGQDSNIVGGPDCDDTNPDIHQGVPDIPYDGIDQDCDGSDLTDVDRDGYASTSAIGDDCNDDDPNIHPGALDIACDHIDQDCDGADLGDVDRDGFSGCIIGGEPPEDCNDFNPLSYPGAVDIPNDDEDQNCDGINAMDADGDGYSTPDDKDCNDFDASRYPGADEDPYDGIDQDCDGNDLTDVDMDGFDATEVDGEDCLDRDPAAYPGADEIAYDGIDQDCNGSDWVDVDGDGYAADVEGVDGPDCNDEDASINPDAVEIPENAVDENCDGLIEDQDGDGYNSYDTDLQDCDDTDESSYPGAVEIPYDGVDQDCEGGDLVDVDGDGHDAWVAGGADCDDNDTDVNPDVEEILDDGIDNNCDGVIDPDDADGDGYSASQSAVEWDCDDNNADVYPGAKEVEDGIDNDCDDVTDEKISMAEQEPGGCTCSSSSPGPVGDGLALTMAGLFVWMRFRRNRVQCQDRQG